MSVVSSRLSSVASPTLLRAAANDWPALSQGCRVSGIELPPGLRESERLPVPIFTPSTKAEVGHDEAIDFEQTVELLGDRALAEKLREVSLAVYRTVSELSHASEKGKRDAGGIPVTTL